MPFFSFFHTIGLLAPIVEKMVETRLRWFGHVESKPVDFVARRVDRMEGSQITKIVENLEKL